MKRFVISLGIFAYICATCIGMTAHAKPPADFEDLLEARWFEIEMVVFERLDVLDANSSETLTLDGPRSWPTDLMAISTAAEKQAVIDSHAALLDKDPNRFDASRDLADEIRCLGFPTDFYDTQNPIGERLSNLLGRQSQRESQAVAQQQAAADNRDDTANINDNVEMPDSTSTEGDPLAPLEAPSLDITPYEQLLTDVAAFEQQLWDSNFTWLENLTMVGEVKSLNRQRNLRPLIHRRWRQSVPARSAPQPVYIASEITPSAPITTAGLAKIEGFVSVTVGRYLHFAPTLWFHADTLGLSPIAFPIRVPLRALPTAQYMQLQESRRMRSGEWHYLDHPKFGVIVRIDPITVPATLLDAHAALVEGGN